MVEAVLWAAGFVLLLVVAIYAAGHHRKGQSAANKILEQRNLRSHRPLGLQREQYDSPELEKADRLGTKESQDG